MDLLEEKVLNPRGVLLAQASHLCLVVRDVEQSARAYSLLGVGPFTLRLIRTPAHRGLVRGQPTGYTLHFAYAQLGGLTLELVQPVAGDSLQAEFLEHHGEGLHHVGYPVPAPLDTQLTRWQELGIEPLQVNYREDPRYGWAYMDTQTRLGCIVEIVADPPGGWWQAVALRQLLREE